MKLFLLFSYIFYSALVGAEGLTVVAIGDAEKEVDKIVFTSSTSIPKWSLQLKKVLQNDFGFYKNRFKVVKQAGEGSSVRYSVYLDFSLSNVAKVELRDREQSLLSFQQVKLKNIRTMAHIIADQLYQKITGKKSIFKSKIIFVSDLGSSRRKVVKELYQMDFDGGNVRRLTYHRGFVISPAVSKDGSKVLYSLISAKSKRRKKRNINLRLLNLKTMKSRLISSRPGINSGAVFLDDGDNILLTLSIVGNAEIYKLNLNTKRLTRLTRNGAQDVDPSITADGTVMTFLSDRAGNAMIYTMDPRGVEKNVRRISFVGKFNATPRFAPNGTEIAFSSWLDNRFDIFRIGADGNNLVRLTKNFGSNEDPTFSPDGEFIAFSSQRVRSRRSVDQNIYIIDREGGLIGQITRKFGKCITPRWSN